VDRGVEIAVAGSGQGDRVSQSRREAPPIGLFLVQLIRVELPDSRTGVELGARVMARRLTLSVALLAGVGRRADVDEQRSVLEHEVVGMVRATHRQAGDDGVGLADRRQRARSNPVADDRVARSRVEVVALESDAGSDAGAEVLPDVGLAVAIGVPQRHDAAAGFTSRLGVDEHISVRRDDEVTRAVDTIGEEGSTEAVG